MLGHYHCDLRDSEENSKATEDVFWGDVERPRELQILNELENLRVFVTLEVGLEGELEIWQARATYLCQ